jgi:hypothetical protein
LSFQGRRFSWTFLLAAVSFPIIDVDFLRHFKGTVSRDFLLLVFFINQFPPSPRVSH